jgi:hypothetical protein
MKRRTEKREEIGNGKERQKGRWRQIERERDR